MSRADESACGFLNQVILAVAVHVRDFEVKVERCGIVLSEEQYAIVGF